MLTRLVCMSGAAVLVYTDTSITDTVAIVITSTQM